MLIEPAKTPGESIAQFYVGWPEYQRLLVDAIRPLTPEQLALSVARGAWPIWQLASHIIGVRAGWFHYTLGEGDAAIEEFGEWGGRDGGPRPASELVRGLEATWALVSSCLDRWTAADLPELFEDDGPKSRGWVVWHVLEHDIHHGGEVSLTLGAHGLPALDL